MKRLSVVVFVVAMALACPPGLAADDDEEERSKGYARENQPAGWGLRVGVADDPDQIIIGGQYTMGGIAKRVYFEPNLELGLGDDHTIFTATGAMHYHFRVKAKVFPYAGAGLTLGLDRHDRGDTKDTDFLIALKFVGGVSWNTGETDQFFLELQLGTGELWNAEVVAGWRF
jgi:hypothetical protein